MSIKDEKTATNSVMAVACAEDSTTLKCVYKAQKQGLSNAILCGNKQSIADIAKKESIDISGFEIVHCEDEIASARTAVSLVRKRNADMLMKGMLQTADLLRCVLDKENGLRKQAVLSHVSILKSPILERTILLTDAAMVTYPDLNTKVSLIQNAVEAANGLDIATPKVAVLAAVEVVNPNMQATLDAAALTVMNMRNQIKNCIVDGPLAMDLALSKTACKKKSLNSRIAGDADILLLHNIEAANSVLKTFVHAGECAFGGVVMGATAPIVLVSRSDDEENKLYSIACAGKISKTIRG